MIFGLWALYGISVPKKRSQKGDPFCMTSDSAVPAVHRPSPLAIDGLPELNSLHDYGQGFTTTPHCMDYHDPSTPWEIMGTPIFTSRSHKVVDFPIGFRYCLYILSETPSVLGGQPSVVLWKKKPLQGDISGRSPLIIQHFFFTRCYTLLWKIIILSR